jgi:hypothetical protein
VFGFTPVLGLALFHTTAKRQVSIKQGSMSTLLYRRQCELDWLHNAVIIANWELLVNQTSVAFLQPHMLLDHITSNFLVKVHANTITLGLVGYHFA